MTLMALPRPSRLSLVERIKQIWPRGSFRTDDAKIAQYLGPGQTDSGETVGIEGAMQLATVWACVRLISETVATLPLFLYRKGAKDSRTVAKDHTLYLILHDSPHADYTAVEFWEGVVASLCLWGNAYAEKQISGGRLIGLEPLRCDLMSVVRDRNGAREYRYSDRSGMRVLSEDKVFHVRGFGSGCDVGFSPIAMARQSLGTARAAERTAARMFKNGLLMSMILKMDQILKPDQRKDIRENIIAPLAGSLNAGGVFLAEAGMTPHQVTMNPEDAQFLETRRFHVEELCRWFRVPPFMVGHTEKSTSWGTGIEQQNIGFLTYALRPYLTRIEQAIKRSLLRPEERATLYAEFEVDGLLRADSKTRTDNLVQLTQNGILTRNEARGVLNWPAKDGADELTVQQQNVPLGQKPQAALPPPSEDDEED